MTKTAIGSHQTTYFSETRMLLVLCGHVLREVCHKSSQFK